MKILGSALALVLVGLAAVWLWFDSTATVEQDASGVVITGRAPDPATATGPSPQGNASLQREVDAARAQDARAADAATLVAVLGRVAEATLEAAADAAPADPSSTPEPAPAPQPVQPAPVSPGLCWDDDEWEECDWDDDWDD